MLPVASLVDQGSDFAAPPAEHQRGDRHALRVFRAVRVAGILPRGDGETGIRMGGGTAGRIVWAALPIDYGLARSQPFPPRLVVRRHRDIREKGVAPGHVLR